MYRRYQPGTRMQPPKQGKPTAGELDRIKRQPQQQRKTPLLQGGGSQNHSSVRQPTSPPPKPCREEERAQNRKHPILGMLPPAIYNPETKKILGMFSAEDLLLAALIFILLDSKETEDSTLVYLLLYILISDYIDLPF